ncbi:MAG: hypothetical protein ACKV2U_14800 [Bryobacteraceae bacterium]
MNRASRSPPERNFRFRLAQLAHATGCSAEPCRFGAANAANVNGELHASLYLVQSHDGKPRQLCIPKLWEPRIRQAVGDYRELQRLLEEVSELEWKRIREKKEPGG